MPDPELASLETSRVKTTRHPTSPMRPPYDHMRRHADARRFIDRPVHANHDLYRASRYSSRYDGGDRRSRSPRDRSPDRYERASQYSDGDRRRSSAEARSNTSAFQNNRDSFRDNLPRDPPRGPKALLDPPSGPRGGGYAGDFRGRGRGRGRGWVRDDSRDRGRDRDVDFRDRRDGPYRDERSRERDRDWDRRDRESYRGRPRSPGRGRSPPQRDFRDRDPPLGVDAERSRRGSRDGGPPSAGSSNSDPPFGMARGGFRGGRDRGRGGWDRGRGRGGFYDDRDRFRPRSRSQEGRWGRDRDERDRGDRWIDPDARRDARDDRDPRERELLRPKVDRERDRGMSSQAPSPNTKDVSPPPLAPSAPAFGTVPSRNVGAADGSPIIGGTGKLPPTAPRAFNAERPVSAGHGGGDFPVPPTGPAKMNLTEGSPPIPSGPRAQQQKQQRPSSKQWINPALNGKKIPESPKTMRSQSFAQQQRPVPFRHESVPAEHGDYDRRPRSSDAKADSHNDATEGSVNSLNLPEPGEIIVKSERDSYSARGSIDRDLEHTDARDTVMTGNDVHGYEERRSPPRSEDKPFLAERVAIDKGSVERKEEPPRSAKKTRMSVSRVRFVLPLQDPPAPVSEQTSESDDDEDYGEYFAMEIAKEEAELESLREVADNAPDKIIARYAKVSHDALAALVLESEGLVDMLGPVPDIVEPVKEEPPPKSPVVEQRGNTPQALSPVMPIKSSPEQIVAVPEPEAASVPDPLVEKKPEQVIVEKETDTTTDTTARKEVGKQSEDEVEKEVGKQLEKESETAAEEIVEKPTEKPTENPDGKSVEEPQEKVVDNDAEIPEVAAKDAAEKAPEPDVEKVEVPQVDTVLDEPQPKTEEMDVDEPAPISAPSPPRHPEATNVTDVAMEDVVEPEKQPSKPVAEREEPHGPLTNGHPILLQPPGVPVETIEGDKALPSTPSQMEDDDEDDSTESDDVDADTDAMLIDTVRQYSATPPIDSLPDYSCRAWSRDRDFLESLDSDPIVDDFILQQLDKISLEKLAGQEIARKDYAENYVKYLDFTVSSDPIAVKSRETFISCLPTPEKHVPIPPPPELKPEGRGAGRRYASERDLERVLQASMREDEERKEREQRAMQEKYRSDKEAVIPEMYWTKEDRDAEFFKDTTGFTPVEKLVPAWQILPPINNFTPEEAELFEKRYLTNPKQWGVVAENIPKRNFGTCIQYYYLMKKELNLKEKLKKQPKRRKKGSRGKTRSSALVSELGNPENEGDENQENGENGERRRPRRAAAPTWGFEQPPTDSDNATPAGTPGRRGAKADPEKPDGRKRGRRAAKDKEPKAAKPQQTLAAAPAPASAKGRSRSNSRVQNTEFQPPPPVPMENRLPSQFEVPTTGVQPPFVPAPQPPLVVQERPVSLTPSAISEVMAPPSLRPEPPPPPSQPTIATFDIAQPQPERRAQSQASSYWSVSEANDFPGLLKSFGTDWTAIAGHMGSKTAVMVKNYFVRQKDQGKAEWEQFAAEADAKRVRGEKLPDPPPPTVGGRKKYDSAPASSHRPLASAPATPVPSATTEPQSEVPATKVETPVQQPGNPPFGRFTMPITPAPLLQPQQQPLAQAPPPVPTTTQTPPQAPQQTPAPIQQQHPAAQPAVTQSESPISRPLRAPSQQAFGFQERERESAQPVRISQKPSTISVTEPAQQRPLAAAQPIQPAQSELQIDRQHAERQQMERQAMERQQMERQQLERQRMEQQQIERQQIERQQIERQQIERQQMERQQIERQQIERQQMERQQLERQAIERQQIERQQLERQQMERQQAERQQMERQKMEAQQSKEHLRPTERTRLKQEPEMTPPHHHYEPFSYGQQPVRSVPPPRSEPPAGPRQTAEPPRSVATPVPQAYGQPMPQPGGRLLGDPQPSVSTPPGQRPNVAQRPMPTHMDSYGTPPQQPQSLSAAASRPSASERKTSNIMSLLNDDPPSAAAAAAPTPPPQPKRLNDMTQVKPSPTPPPQSMSRGPAPPPAPTPLRPEREAPQAYPYGRNAPSASAMPPLKPTYTASPQAQHMSAPRSTILSPHDSGPALEREFYRSYQHQPQATNSPQIAQPYTPQSQPSRDAYQPQTGYPGYGAPAAHAGSPPAQYAVHPSASRREPPPPQNRESAWPPGPQGHAMGQPQPPQQQPSWPPQSHPATHAQPPKRSQQAPPPQNWASPHMSSQKAPPSGSAVPQQSWASGPPQQQQQQQQQPQPPQQQQPPPHHHMPMRDDRGASIYGQIPPQHQHAMQGRYPPVSRAPEPMPPQAQQAYPPRYASTPAPGDQMPPRSYTPVGYDARGPPAGPYPPDPREMQMREMSRDPRDPRDPREIQQQEMLQRQLRPHDAYGRQPDRYGR